MCCGSASGPGCARCRTSTPTRPDTQSSRAHSCPSGRTLGMAVHLRGVLLPDDEVRDLWLDGDRVSCAPVPGAETIASGGFILPGLVDAHCHLGIASGGSPVHSIDQARELARVDRDGGVEVPDADLPATIAEQAKAGNGWVKLVGDWIDRQVGDLAPAFAAESMAAAIEAAHAAGARVATHTFSEEAVAILVRAGVDSVEHGTVLSLDLIDEMARRGTALVPTMINVRTFDKIAARAAGKFPTYASHLRALEAGFPAVVRAAHEAGVAIYVGSDAGGGIAHGRAVDEMLLLHESVGLTPIEVLREPRRIVLRGRVVR